MKCNEFTKNARNKILIQKPVLVADAYGGSTNTWTDVGSYWAWIKPTSLQEQFINVQMQGFSTQKMIIRYSNALKDTSVVSSYRITFESRIFSIKGIKNLDNTMRNYGRDFQELQVVENDNEIA